MFLRGIEMQYWPKSGQTHVFMYFCTKWLLFRQKMLHNLWVLLIFNFKVILLKMENLADATFYIRSKLLVYSKIFSICSE